MSNYRSQADRLRREIASLEAKAADERSKANRERSEALRVRNSIGRTPSPSATRSKLSEIQRREENAVAYEKRAAGYGDQISRKSRDLTAAQAALERALDQARKKDESEQRRRREEELRHIERLESVRRAAQREVTHAPSMRFAATAKSTPGEYRYDVCLSFAGEDRAYVEMVAAGLAAGGLRVFYDEDEKVTLWGKDLIEYFDHIYREASRYCVMFISDAYAAKPWTRHERRSALARALVEEGEYILPARFDETQLPGLPPTIGYLDLRETAPATLVEHILRKLGVSATNSKT